MGAIVVVIVLLFALLIGRLYNLQVANDSQYVSISDQNRIRLLYTTAKRGEIYDANGTVLATSTPVFTISLMPAEIEDPEALAEVLVPLLADEEITAETIVEALENQSRSYEPVVLKRYPYEEGLLIVSRLEEMQESLPGVVIAEEPMRYYPQGSLAGHLIGYVGKLSEDETDLIAEYNYQLNDWLGKSGLEATMERFDVDGTEIGLRGTRGLERVEVDSNSQPVRTISSQEPIPGHSYVLTIDAEVQAAMEQSLADMVAQVQQNYPKCRVASAVLLNVKTGAVIAMASYPALDPNDFANGLSQEKADYYFNNEDRPLLNRAYSGSYPPGSTFKVATAAAILASGQIDPNETVVCSPSNWPYPRAKCTSSHGEVDMTKALALSCNTYFQEMAYRIGIDRFYSSCYELGLGQLTGIELTNEVAGLLPSPEWKEETFKDDPWEYTWRDYDTFYMSIGQGYNLVTPLQLANCVATIANGGDLLKPYLVQTITDAEGNVVYEAQRQVTNHLTLDEEGLEKLRAGMRAVIEPGGTASSVFRDFPIQVAGKTGTAQTGIQGDDPDEDFHGVFVAFAPYEDPEVAFACVVEYGHRGGTTAGVVCREVLNAYFELDASPLPDWLPESSE